MQQFDVDYEDIFASVIHFESLQVLFAIAVRKKMFIYMMNTQNAYLNSKLDKKIYMKTSEGVDNAGSSGLVCLLLKSIYGLKQSASLWNKKITSTVRSFGFLPTTAEPSIFIDQRSVIIALYVDDLLIFTKDKSDIKRVKKLIKKTHSMKNIGEVLKVLGIHVTRESNSSIKINQNHYINQILVEFGMENAKSAATSMNSSIKLDNQISEMLFKKDHKLY